MLHRDTLLRLCQAKERLRGAGERDLSVLEVATELGMSQYHFIRLFKAVFGETPKQVQLRAKMERAKHLLMMTESSVTDICMDVGFSSLGTFSTVFTAGGVLLGLSGNGAVHGRPARRNPDAAHPGLSHFDGRRAGLKTARFEKRQALAASRLVQESRNSCHQEGP
jgi:AraC-like DNA-binding protein